MARAGTNLRTSYLESNEVLRRPYQKLLIALILAAALMLPFGSSDYFLHLINLCFLACVGALGLMILTGFCGQISLGHAAFLAIGAFTTVILTVHLKCHSSWLCRQPPCPAPSLGSSSACRRCDSAASISRSARLRCTTRSSSCARPIKRSSAPARAAGITIADPVIGPLRLRGEYAWYYFLLALVTLVTIGCVNLVRTRPGRAWMAIRDRDIAAEALGINLTRYKLAAFMLSATLASVSGASRPTTAMW